MSQYRDPATAEVYARNLARTGHSPVQIATAYNARTGQQLPAALAQELGYRPPVAAAPLPEGILSAEQTTAELNRIETLPRSERKIPDKLMESWEFHSRQGVKT